MHKRFGYSIIAFLFAVGFLSGCGNNKEFGFFVSVDECTNHKIVKNVNVTGVVESDNAGVYTVSSKIPYYCVRSMNVHIGDEVKKGDVICELDTSDIEKNIRLLEEKIAYFEEYDTHSINGYKEKIRKIKELLDIKLAQIEDNRKSDQKKYDEIVQQCNNARSELENAERDCAEAANALENASAEEAAYYSDKYMTLMQTIDLRRTEIDTYSSLLYDLEGRLSDYTYQKNNASLEAEKEIGELQLIIDTYQSQDELKKQLQELRDSLDDCVIYAPCSGIVRDINVTNGQICSDSSIATIVQADKKNIHVRLNDNDILLVKEGMKVEVTFGQQSVTGEVTRVNRIKGEDGFDVYIDVTDDDTASIGLSVSNSIKIIDKDVLSVSRDAVMSDNGNYYVMVAELQPDGSYIAESKSVTVGIQDDENIEICSGISEGDLVITDKTDDITDGVRVEISMNYNEE